MLVLISVTGSWGPKSVFSLTAVVGNGTIAAYASKALLVDHTLVGNPFEAVFICRIIHFIKTSLILRLLLVKTHSAAPTLLLSSSSPREDFILISLSETCCSTIGQIDTEQSLSVWWRSARRFERSSFGDLSIYWAALRAAGWSSTRPSCPRGLGPAEPNPGGGSLEEQHREKRNAPWRSSEDVILDAHQERTEKKTCLRRPSVRWSAR